MNIDFCTFKSSIGKRLKFEVVFHLKDDSTFTDVFYAYLREVFDDYIIVEQFTIETDVYFENSKITSKLRKLEKKKFDIDTKEIPLNF
jgi:deoxyadenosine/deoxycytidine kinase